MALEVDSLQNFMIRAGTLLPTLQNLDQRDQLGNLDFCPMSACVSYFKAPRVPAPQDLSEYPQPSGFFPFPSPRQTMLPPAFLWQYPILGVPRAWPEGQSSGSFWSYLHQTGSLKPGARGSGQRRFTWPNKSSSEFQHKESRSRSPRQHTGCVEN